MRDRDNKRKESSDNTVIKRGGNNERIKEREREGKRDPCLPKRCSVPISHFICQVSVDRLLLKKKNAIFPA